MALLTYNTVGARRILWAVLAGWLIGSTAVSFGTMMVARSVWLGIAVLILFCLVFAVAGRVEVADLTSSARAKLTIAISVVTLVSFALLALASEGVNLVSIGALVCLVGAGVMLGDACKMLEYERRLAKRGIDLKELWK